MHEKLKEILKKQVWYAHEIDEISNELTNEELENLKKEHGYVPPKPKTDNSKKN